MKVGPIAPLVLFALNVLIRCPQARVLTLKPQPMNEALAKGRARQHTLDFQQRYAGSGW